MIISITESAPANHDADESWFVYVLQCSDNSLYTGITNNLEKRIETHNKKKGAKYTRARLPVVLKYFERVANKSLAAKREIAIKKLSKAEKIRLISNNNLF